MLEEDVTRILRMREGGQVQRCHCFPHHGSYDVAQHCFHMLVLLEELHPDPPRRLYSQILRHDLFERWTGDAPAALKRVAPQAKIALRIADERIEEATGIDRHRHDLDVDWLKALDELEFLMWCDDQIALGSRIATVKRDEVIRSLQDSAQRLPVPVLEFLEAYEWRRTPDDLAEEEEACVPS